MNTTTYPITTQREAVNTTRPKLTVAQAAHLADKADGLFERAAQKWVNGNNSGDPRKMERCNALCENYRGEAERLLEPLGIECDYPGLFPCFKVNGFDHYTALSAISAALEEKP